MDLGEWRAAIARDWSRIKDAPSKVKGDRLAAMAAVRQSPEALHFLERHLQLDRQIVLAAIASHRRPQAASNSESTECAFETAAARAMEDVAALGSMALELGYSTLRFTQVLCDELTRAEETESSNGSQNVDPPVWRRSRAASCVPSTSSGNGRNSHWPLTRSERDKASRRVTRCASPVQVSPAPDACGGHWTRSICTSHRRSDARSSIL